MAVVRIEEDPNRVVSGVQLEQDPGGEACQEGCSLRWDKRADSIVFSTSSRPRLVSRSRLPNVARRSPMIFSTWPQTWNLGHVLVPQW